MASKRRIERYEADAYELGRQLANPRKVRLTQIVRKEVRLVDGEPHLIEEHTYIEEADNY